MKPDCCECSSSVLLAYFSVLFRATLVVDPRVRWVRVSLTIMCLAQICLFCFCIPVPVSFEKTCWISNWSSQRGSLCARLFSAGVLNTVQHHYVSESYFWLRCVKVLHCTNVCVFSSLSGARSLSPFDIYALQSNYTDLDDRQFLVGRCAILLVLSSYSICFFADFAVEFIFSWFVYALF